MLIKEQYFKNCVVVISLLILICTAAFADTIIVGKDGQSDIIKKDSENITKTMNNTESKEIEEFLRFIQLTSQDRSYLEAINNRTRVLEAGLLESVESSKDTIEILTEENNKLSDENRQMMNEFEVYKETQNTRFLQLQNDLNNKTWQTIIVAILVMLITAFGMEWVRGITLRKRLYFALRKFRDQFPINIGMFFGDDKDE